jgi:hypothetical protein
MAPAQPPASVQALSDFSGEITKITVEHGQDIAVLKADLRHMVDDRARCNADHNRQLEELTVAVKALTENSALRREQFEWRREVLRAVLAVVLTLLTLGIGGKAALPTITDAVADSVAKSVTQSLEAGAAQ